MQYYALLTLVQILFGLNFVASKIVVGNWSAFGFASWRFIISGLFLLFYLKMRGRSLKLEREFWKPLFMLALVGFSISQSLFLWGLQHTTAANTALISSTIPVFVFIINRIRKIGTWSVWKAFGLCLSFTGVLILRKVEDFSFSNESFVGDLFVMVACASLGWLISYSKDFYGKVQPLVGSAHMFWLGGLLLVPVWLIFGQPLIPAFETRFVVALVYSIFGATCLTYLLNNIVLTKVDSDVVGLFIFLQPVVASVVAVSFLGEVFTMRMGFSFILIALGVLFVVRK
ncbi:MAG: DMT family transporter [Halobacteriovoraceae bacterium]|nr:DMT family transporter [Halobacteriovoraceae bacterium]